LLSQLGLDQFQPACPCAVVAVVSPVTSCSSPCILPSWPYLEYLASQHSVCPDVATICYSSSLDVIYRRFDSTFIYCNVSIAVFWPLIPVCFCRKIFDNWPQLAAQVTASAESSFWEGQADHAPAASEDSSSSYLFLPHSHGHCGSATSVPWFQPLCLPW
jgi:hypothetical protein